MRRCSRWKRTGTTWSIATRKPTDWRCWYGAETVTSTWCRPERVRMARNGSKLDRRKGGERRATPSAELVIITGLSGSGKGSVLKVFEDLGYYSVDNLPIGLIPKFAELTRDSASIRFAALVVDIREGHSLKGFPAIYARIRREIPSRLIFMEADDDTIVRRFSETRRPHPLGTSQSISKSIRQERVMLTPIRKLADLTINTSKFTVH